MKIFVVQREGYWWPNRSDKSTLAPFSKVIGARYSRQSAESLMNTAPDEPEWFVGETIVDGKSTLCCLVTGVAETELTE